MTIGDRRDRCWGRIWIKSVDEMLLESLLLAQHPKSDVRVLTSYLLPDPGASHWSWYYFFR